MISTRNIERSANPLRMIFSSVDRTTVAYHESSFNVDIGNFIDRFDMTRPVYAAVESLVLENVTPSADVVCLVWVNSTNDTWSSNRILNQCIGMARSGVSDMGRLTRDTLGTPLNRGVLVGGMWTFMFTDVEGNAVLDADLNQGYLFTLVLWQ
jgi:hypothetical protein